MVKVSSWISRTALWSRWLVGKHAEKMVVKPAKQGESNTFFTGRLQRWLWLEGMGRGQPWEVGGSSKTSSVRWMVARAPLLLLLSSPVPASSLPVATSAPHSFGEGPSAALWALPTFRKIEGARGYRYLVAWGAG